MFPTSMQLILDSSQILEENFGYENNKRPGAYSTSPRKDGISNIYQISINLL